MLTHQLGHSEQTSVNFSSKFSNFMKCFRNVACKISAILFRPQWVNSLMKVIDHLPPDGAVYVHSYYVNTTKAAREESLSPHFNRYMAREVETWWRHDLDMLTESLALCKGNPPVIGGFLSQRASDTVFCAFQVVCWLLHKSSSCWWCQIPWRSSDVTVILTMFMCTEYKQLQVWYTHLNFKSTQ